MAVLGYRITNNRWAGNLSGQSYDDVTFQASADNTISAPFIAAATQLFTPTLSATGDAEISAPFIAAATQLFTPTLVGEAIEAPFIAAATQLFTPTLSATGDAEISAPFIAAATQAFTPTLALRIFPPFIEARTEVFTPGINVIFAPCIGAKATLTTRLTGANNDLVFTAVRGGDSGNGISVTYVRGGPSQPLTVEVAGSLITVFLASNASANPTSTAAQVKAAIEAYPPAAALVTVAHAAGNDGSGVPEPLPRSFLAGGQGTVGAGVLSPTILYQPWGPGPGPSSTPAGGGAAVAHAIYQLTLCDRFSQPLAEITTITFEKKGAYRLNRPTIWTGRVPARHPLVKGLHSDGQPKLCSGHRALKVHRNGRLIFHGYILRVERNADANSAWASFIAIDPLHWFAFRVVRDETGNFSDPDYTSPITGGEIVRRMVTNTIDWEGAVGLELGSFDETIPPGIDLGVKLENFPIPMGEMLTLVTESGVCDVRVNPREDTPFVMGSIDAKNRIGTNKSGSVHLDFAGGDNSIASVRFSDDMDSLVNRLIYFLGTRINPTHWPANVTGTGPLMPNPPQAAIDALIAQSRAAIGVFMRLSYYDSGHEEAAHTLFRKLWQRQAAVQATPRELLHVTPAPGGAFQPFDDYEPGDEIALNVDEDGLGIDVAGTQRVFGFDVMPDTNGVERVGELVTSADAA